MQHVVDVTDSDSDGDSSWQEMDENKTSQFKTTKHATECPHVETPDADAFSE